jgi:hypothetical protein
MILFSTEFLFSCCLRGAPLTAMALVNVDAAALQSAADKRWQDQCEDEQINVSSRLFST